MKKIIILQIILIALAVNLYSQVKVNFNLGNPINNEGIFSFDVIATVPAGQLWRVGPTNIRISFNTIPTGAVTLMEDNPAMNANLHISGNTNYANMTTTGIEGDTAISLNILLVYTDTAYTFNPGTYTLGSVRFTIIDSTACINTTIQPISAVFDNLTPLSYNSGWTKNDIQCAPIGINVRQINKVPNMYKLYQNYPNPFNPTTTIKFQIPRSENVKMEIYDLLGRLVETVTNTNYKAGIYEFNWDGTNYASGLYFYRIIAGNFVQTNKMLLIK